jgi:ATP-dependent Clp protease ATP-binding subunit ClpC
LWELLNRSTNPFLIEFIVAEGFRPEYGARELERTMERLIAKPLADAILRGTIQPGQKALAQLAGGCIVLAK